MKSTELRKALRFHRDTKPIFKGVFPCNRLPQFIPRGKTVAFIANTDPAHKPGQHWVAFFYTSTHVYYFDSYGLPPANHYFHRMMKYRKIKKVFGRRLQGMGQVCGHYCLFFILAMVYKMDFTCFGDDYRANDTYVKNFVQQHFPFL